MSNTKPRNIHGYIASLVVVLVSIAATLLLLANRQAIIDRVTAWQYVPSSEISGFTDRTAMSEQGKFLFFASQPSLEGTQAFNDKCARVEKSAAILGCYDGHTIYVYNVANQKLDGIREVTAAHEMLHAAYLRMNDRERKAVDGLVEAEYTKLSSNADFAERMAFYARTEPGERDNELHSIIGTEVATLSPDLERHYGQYFTDRSKVVALHTKYASVFAGVQARSKELSDQLTALKTSIDTHTTSYNNEVQQLNQAIASFNARATNGGFSSQAEFNTARAALVARANGLEASRASINDERTRYGMLRDELIAIASESEALNQSIDSTLAPAPSL